MIMSRHARARFKQRQKLKNEDEMRRRCHLAIARGNLVASGSKCRERLCYEYAGYRYIVSRNLEVIITAFPIKRYGRTRRRYLVDQSRIRQFEKEIIESLEARKMEE